VICILLVLLSSLKFRTIYLANYEVVDLTNQPGNQPNGLRIYIQNKVLVFQAVVCHPYSHHVR
jgi:hypothetical protein